MFRLTGADLPTSKKESVRVVPIFRVWQGNNRGMGVIARINTYANYDASSFNVHQIDIPPPIATGYLLKYLLPFTFKSPKLEGFQFLSDATNPLPNTIWIGDGFINVYSPQLTFSSPFTVTLLLGAPIPGRPVELLAGFMVNHIVYQAALIPFTQEDTTLTLQPDYPIAVGDELEIIGSYSASVEFVGYAANFLFSELDYIDRFDWMGTSFAPAPDATNPQAGQFVWNENLKLCTIFSSVPINSGIPSLDWDYSKLSSPLSPATTIPDDTVRDRIEEATISAWAGMINVAESVGVNAFLTTGWNALVVVQENYASIVATSNWTSTITTQETPTGSVVAASGWQSIILQFIGINGIVGCGSTIDIPAQDTGGGSIPSTSGWQSVLSSTIAFDGIVGWSSTLSFQETPGVSIPLTSGWQSIALQTASLDAFVGNMAWFDSTDAIYAMPLSTGWISTVTVQETPGVSIPLTSGWTSFALATVNLSSTTQWQGVSQTTVNIISTVNTRSTVT